MSANQTVVQAVGGILLAGSSATTSGGPAKGGIRMGEAQRRGHILLAPGAGSGVGVGPVFSSRDLLSGQLPSRKAHLPTCAFDLCMKGTMTSTERTYRCRYKKPARTKVNSVGVRLLSS